MVLRKCDRFNWPVHRLLSNNQYHLHISTPKDDPFPTHEAVSGVCTESSNQRHNCWGQEAILVERRVHLLYPRRSWCAIRRFRAQLERRAVSVTNPSHSSAIAPRAGGCGGFTLLELLVVVAIIGVLVSYVGPKYFGQVGKSQVQSARVQMDAFAKALDAYRLDVGRYPTTAQTLRALVERPAGEGKWAGPYLQGEVPADPWGQPYQFRAPGANGRELELWSHGRDGRPGGTGEDADITVSR